MLRPERVANVCLQVHACFTQGERAESLAPVLHTGALVLLQRFDRLPPHRQSLSTISANIAAAFQQLCRQRPELEGLSSGWRFGVRSTGDAYDPHLIRRAVQLVTTLTPLDARAFADGMAMYLASVELQKRGLPANLPLLAYRLLAPSPAASLLEWDTAFGSIAWTIAALHRTYSPQETWAPALVVVETDRWRAVVARMLAALGAASGCAAFTVCESRYIPAERSPLHCDRLIALPEAVSDGFLRRCLAMLDQGGRALILLPTAQFEQWWSEQLRQLCTACALEALLHWKHTDGGRWTFALLRLGAVPHRRRHVLVGMLGEALVEKHVEQIAWTLRSGATTAPWLQWCTRQEALASATRVMAVDLSYLVEQLAGQGVDIGHLIVERQGRIAIAEAIADSTLLERAVRSAPSVRQQEMRYYFTLHWWWHRAWALLSTQGLRAWQQLSETFVEHVSSVPLTQPPWAHALISSWWAVVEPDLYGVEHYGARAVVESIFSSIERKLRMQGLRLWQHLDEREELTMAYFFPHLLEQVRQEHRLRSSVEHTQMREFDQRIAALEQQLAAYRNRMHQLHRQAKAHDVPHDARELFDSTAPLQDELSTLLAALVLAQTELKMLQQQRATLTTEQTIPQYSPIIARSTAQLLPALHHARRQLTQQHAWEFLGSMWHEQFARRAEQWWEQLLAEIIEQLACSMNTSATELSKVDVASAVL